MTEQIRNQTNAFLKGFFEIIPQKFIKYLTV